MAHETDNRFGGCLEIVVFIGGFFFFTRIGVEVGVPWLGLAFVAVFYWYLSSKKAEEERLLVEKEKARQQEEERKRNSPEEIERRRQEAERMRMRLEEQERQWKAKEERKARDKWNEYHHAMRIEEVDNMSGIHFENLVFSLLERTGYSHMRLTPTNDQGADILCDSPAGNRMVVQTKRWQGPVGNSAVQEVMGALIFYDAQEAMVFTNSRFTESARNLAGKDARITLVGRHNLAAMLERAFPKTVPEFSWDEFNHYVKNWRSYKAEE